MAAPIPPVPGRRRLPSPERSTPVSSAPHAAAHRAPGDDPQTERSPRRRALRLRTRLAVVTAATLAIAAGGTYFAFADTTTGDGAITGTSNGSDPELIQCPNSTN